jgi:hypothetical protein
MSGEGDLAKTTAGAVPNGLAGGIAGGERAGVGAGQDRDGDGGLFHRPALEGRNERQLLVGGDTEQVCLRLGEGGQEHGVCPFA